MIDELSGRIALVTGAAGGGIGQAIATRLAPTALPSWSPIHTRAASSTLPKQSPRTTVDVLAKQLDVGDRDQIVEVAGWVRDELGPITMLVNNAAYNIMGSIFDYDPADWDRVLAVNLSGPWMLSKLAMTQMRDAGLPGVILNVSTYAPDVGGAASKRRTRCPRVAWAC